uniref:Uncharacterized protein n=1 Tax=Arundo donax TaxID=35708 RepID=A0A0A9B1J2_ARUDO
MMALSSILLLLVYVGGGILFTCMKYCNE